MKRSIVIASLTFFGALALLSCKKDYECSCHTAAGAHEHVIISAKKNDAAKDCEAKAVGTYTACELE